MLLRSLVSSFWMFCFTIVDCWQWQLTYIVIIIDILFLLLCPHCTVGLNPDLQEDAHILLAFKRHITHDPFQVLQNWDAQNISAFCNWTGVICSQRHHRVTQLNLQGRLLQGSMAPELGGLSHLLSLILPQNRLSGHIPSSLGNCSNLHFLSLANNSLTGSIPSKFGLLHSLQALFLWDNNLTGRIPPSLGNCSKLVFLELDQNQLSGSIPAEIGMLSNLQTFTLYSNSLSGPLPHHLGNCTALQVARLEMNQLQGSLPAELWMLPNITSFWVYDNKISGEIPSNLGNCTSLVELSLETNNITGPIPAWLPVHLASLDLGSNELSGLLPEELGMLHELQLLWLAGNNLITGAIPASLGNCSQLNEIGLGQNRLQGAIPTELGKLTQLYSLKLGTNHLTGEVPQELANCTVLQIIDLDQNQLEGSLPAQLGNLLQLQTLIAGQNRFTDALPPLNNCTFLQALALEGNDLTGSMSSWEFGALNKLHFLDFSSNHLRGTISSTSLGNCTNMETLYLSGNRLAGSIPSSIGKLQSLQQLDLSYNDFTAKIPYEICKCIQLGILVLSHNKLNGTLPQNLGMLRNLNTLYLDSNFVTGVIPESIGGCFQVSDLDLSDNNLEGEIPSSLSALRYLEYNLNLSHNKLSGPIPQWLGGAGMLQSLDLSSNRLSGSIPESFGMGEMALLEFSLSDNNLSGDIPSSLGSLRTLQSLNLSKNVLGGNVPIEFAHLDSLIQLDVSHNNLSGTVPSFFENMTKLQLLNFSYNSFTGLVPDSGLFKRLNMTSFLGNPGLCGPILHRVCLSHTARHQKHWLGLFKKLAIIVIPTLALLLSIIGLLQCWLQKLLSRHPTQEVFGIFPYKERFTAQDLALATEGYDEKNIIGVGGQSVVYKGILANRKAVIAVKKLKDARLSQDLFLRELHILGKLRHRNLVRILGYVSNLDMKALVMEFIDNGSLEWHLHSCEICQMSWEIRLRIATAVANGLVYLHHECGQAVIHGDLKPSNILIDLEFEAHVADFGIAKLVSNPDSNETSMSTNFKGSIGYMAPEYAYATHISPKVDVYSYGVVLLEMLTVKRPTDAAFGPEMSLSRWVRSYFPVRTPDVLDQTLRLTYSSTKCDELLQLMDLALACTEENPINRPTMKDVSAALSRLVSPRGE